MSVGVPIKVLHDAEGHIVTIESMEGIIYRGKLVEAEDNMNCHLGDLTVTTREGRVLQLQTMYIRGSKIRFLILPDMLKNSPMLKMSKTSATGRGRGTLIRSALPTRGRGGFRGAPRGRGFR